MLTTSHTIPRKKGYLAKIKGDNMSKIFMNDSKLEFEKHPDYASKRKNTGPKVEFQKVDKMPMGNPSVPPFVQSSDRAQQTMGIGTPPQGPEGQNLGTMDTTPQIPTNQPKLMTLDELRILIRAK